jgi:hypothetical protein
VPERRACLKSLTLSNPVKGRELHPGTNELIHDYLDAAGHGEDENGSLVRPLRNNRTGRLSHQAMTCARGYCHV